MHTGDIGLMKIVAETGIAAGIRRVEALTGERAVEWVEMMEERLLRIAERLKGGVDNAEDKVQQLLEQQRKLEKELEQVRGKLVSAAGEDLTSRAIKIGDLFVLAERIDDADPKALRETVDQVKNRLRSAVVVLASTSDDKVNIVAGVTKDRSQQIKAGELVNWLAQRVGGKGGGRPDMAQGGGTEPALLPQALRDVPEWVRQRL
jgi:alanyl-tRNA synthetase